MFVCSLLKGNPRSVGEGYDRLIRSGRSHHDSLSLDAGQGTAVQYDSHTMIMDGLGISDFRAVFSYLFYLGRM